MKTKNDLLLALAALGLVVACKSTPHTEPAKPVTSPANEQKATTTATTAAAKTETITPEEAWRNEQPKPGPERAPVLPAYKTAKLKNGLTVMVSDQRAMLPLVSFQLVSKGGSALDAPEKAGLASLTFGMLAEGAGARDALQFSDALADLGASFDAGADRDRGSASIGGLVRNADAMMGLLADAVLRPTLAEKDFARKKEQTLAQLARSRGSPQGLAFEALPAIVYGPKHPYGHPPTGSLETVKKLTLADVKAARPKLIAPANTALVAAGAITLEEAVTLAEKHFGAWKAPSPAIPKIADVPAKKRSEVVLIDKPGAAQTMVLVARPIFGRGSPDEHPMTVANEVFGGSFSSRLNMDLREDKGYTYGAFSQTAYRAGVGVFLAFGAIRQDATAPALKEIFAQLDGMTTNAPKADEVEHAKDTIQRSLPGAFERTGAIAGAASAIFLYGLPLDYFVHLNARYEKISPDDVQAMVKKWLAPATMQVLLVGDAKAVAEPVKQLDLGKLVVRPVPGL